MPEARVQRLSSKSQRLTTSNEETNKAADKPAIEKKRSRSRDAVKAASKKKSLSPEKSTRRTKSKSPARGSSKSRKDSKKATTSPKATRGAKLYIKKDLVQEIAPEVALDAKPQKRVLRSSSSLSSTTELKSVTKVDSVQNENEATAEQVIESIAPKLNESIENADSAKDKSNEAKSHENDVYIDLGYLKFNKRTVMNIVLVTFILMIFLTLINHYDLNRAVYEERASVYIKSLKQCVENTKKRFIDLKKKFF